MERTPEEIKEKAAQWMELCQSMVNDHMRTEFPNNPKKTLAISYGKKYARVTSESSAWAFINLSTGDILKPATYAAPAKHARGNIFDESEGMAHMGPYGPAYLR